MALRLDLNQTRFCAQAHSLIRKPADTGWREAEPKVHIGSNLTQTGSRNTIERLNVLLRKHAEELFAQILHAESERFMQRFGHLRDELGREAVVRNGFQPERHIDTGIGPVAVRLPKLRCRTGDTAVFRSSVLPRYVRRTREPEPEAVSRYLYGVYLCDLNEALIALLGEQAAHVAVLVPEPVRRAWTQECLRRREAQLAEPATLQGWVEFIESRRAGVHMPAEERVDAGFAFGPRPVLA